MANENQIVKTVAWFMTKRSLIKFQDDAEQYTVAQSVMDASDFVKFPIKKGNNVTIKIENGEIVYLRKASAEAKKEDVKPPETEPQEEPKVENKQPEKTTEVEKPTETTQAPKEEKKVAPQPTGEEKEVYIYAVAGHKNGVKFEKDGDWYQVAKDIQAKDYKVIGLQGRNTAKVIVENGVIVKFTKIEGEKKEEKKSSSTSTKSSSSYDPDVSVRQTAINSASVIVAQVVRVSKEQVSPEKINKMKRAIAEDSLKFIQGE